ncbi:HAMP domain-containing sensor histidine kinase [Halobacillus massiliensis]|uniref:HAMP domain-containing sensor histidine kinase n=1 Tax=Halobacillus massiliensis TaxID=1926286 RepID=UPI0009E4C487|nr:HAMP domain-containing sensor histidine kinase [Halobacillus massiliensis]
MRKWLQSLQVKYLFIILLAVLALPISLPLASLLVYFPGIMLEDTDEPYGSAEQYEERWHEEASRLNGASPKEINEKLKELSLEFPEAGMFWVNGDGVTQEIMNYDQNLPDQWSSSYTVEFMKDNYGADPFTVIAFIGDEAAGQGFMVTQIDRLFIGPPVQRLDEWYTVAYILGISTVMLGFMTLSWFFFRKVHKRLLRLKEAMEEHGGNGIPSPVTISNEDEIGQLEHSFNGMVEKLKAGRQREKQEETIRRDLIANLSHDLRTPLTTIRASLSDISGEITSRESQEKLASVQQKIDYLSHLIDNLLSLTLLTGKRYPYHPKQTEVNRMMKEIAAHWYPTLEQHQIEIELVTSDPVYWEIDPKWMERIFDNLMQNVIRYASEGKYTRIGVKENEITLEDRGPGMKGSEGKDGAGIGLSIVELMVNEMKLHLIINSSEAGTRITIARKDV